MLNNIGLPIFNSAFSLIYFGGIFGSTFFLRNIISLPFWLYIILPTVPLIISLLIVLYMAWQVNQNTSLANFVSSVARLLLVQMFSHILILLLVFCYTEIMIPANHLLLILVIPLSIFSCILAFGSSLPLMGGNKTLWNIMKLLFSVILFGVVQYFYAVSAGLQSNFNYWIGILCLVGLLFLTLLYYLMVLLIIAFSGFT